MDWTAAFVVAVFFGATIIRSALGFGEALVAVPLLAFVLPVKVASPVAVLMSVTVAAVVIAQDWRHVHVGGASRLVLSSLAGIPLGLLLLRSAPEPLVKGGLGLLVVAFAVSAFRQGGSYELKDDRFAWLFGVIAGVLGGAYGMNGPPLVMYGALRRWPPEQFRATLQGYFLLASLVGMIGYWASGLWTADVSRYYALSLPTALLAIAVGRTINRRVETRRFFAYVYAGLLASGAGLLLQVLRD